MANIDQVASQIRFGLDQLSARNAHHDFEHLCRHLTRARICSNVLCWVCRLTSWHREHRYETYKAFTDYREFGGTRIFRS
jgi:hypothetical protein